MRQPGTELRRTNKLLIESGDSMCKDKHARAAIRYSVIRLLLEKNLSSSITTRRTLAAIRTIEDGDSTPNSSKSADRQSTQK